MSLAPEAPSTFEIGQQVMATFNAPIGTKKYPGVVEEVRNDANPEYYIRFVDKIDPEEQDCEWVHNRYILARKKKMYDNTSPEDRSRKKKKPRTK